MIAGLIYNYSLQSIDWVGYLHRTYTLPIYIYLSVLRVHVQCSSVTWYPNTWNQIAFQIRIDIVELV